MAVAVAEYATPCVPLASVVVFRAKSGVLITNDSCFVTETGGVAESVNLRITV